jgi:hypothetical protein
MPAVNPLCTSFPLALRRIGRARAARSLAFVVAFVLAVVNSFAVTMPSPVAPPHSLAGAEHATLHRADCGHAPTHGHAQAGHGSDCACCMGKACTCAHAFGVPVAQLDVAAARPAARPSAGPKPRDYAIAVEPHLRPPIA